MYNYIWKQYVAVLLDFFVLFCFLLTLNVWKFEQLEHDRPRRIHLSLSGQLLTNISIALDSI